MGENGVELLCCCSLPLEIRADFPDTNDFYCDSLLLLQRDKDPHEVRTLPSAIFSDQFLFFSVASSTTGSTKSEQTPLCS